MIKTGVERAGFGFRLAGIIVPRHDKRCVTIMLPVVTALLRTLNIASIGVEARGTAEAHQTGSSAGCRPVCRYPDAHVVHHRAPVNPTLDCQN